MKNAGIVLLILLTTWTHAGCRSAAPAWVGTWGTALQLTEPANLPPAPGLSGNTLRQVVHVSTGGSRIRVHFSNLFGDGPLMLEAVHIALASENDRIEPATGRALTFAGRPSVTIPAGTETTSDAIDFSLPPLHNVAVTIHFGTTPLALTGHPGSRTTSFLTAGNTVTATAMPAAVRTDHWYIVTGIDVVRSLDAAAVVVLGNSITDGRGSGTNKHNRWPDELARRLQSNPATRHIGVLNMGIGGNCVLRECLGPSALDRLQRDVFARSGVRWLIVFEGINDIGTSQSVHVADTLIAAYGRIIARAHKQGIRVLGATLLPFGGSFYDTPVREKARSRVNAWIRTGGAFDAVIDFDAALRDPDQILLLLPAFDTGDHLHPNEAGHRKIAETVDTALFIEGALR